MNANDEFGALVNEAPLGVAASEAQYRRLSEAQAATQRQLEFVMDSMPHKIWTATPRGAIEYLNSQWMEYTGLPLDQIRDWERTGFIHADDLQTTIANWERGFALGEQIRIEHRFQRADGMYRWHISRCLPMRDASGAIERWVGSSTDVHDQRLTADALQRSSDALVHADRRKDEFLAMLAHELRNPLAPISNALHVLQLADRNFENVEVARQIIERQTAQMIRLVDELLDLSRISRGTIELRLQTVDLIATLRQAVETSRPAIALAQRELLLMLPSEPLYLEADPVRLVQVFGNLLNNAGKYTNRGGRIVLSAERDGGEVVVTIRDSGVGIPLDMLQRVFEMFTQVDHSLERSRGGLGIGLSLAQRVVELHGGSITAFSAGLDQGSEFVVRLPALAGEHPVPIQLQPPANILPAARRVLVADDNRDSADSLALYLQLIGHETRIAYDGLQAVETAATFHPDLVLLDIGMPNLNGYEAARRMRQEPWGQSITLVALSGWGLPNDRRQSTEAGMNHHWVKPVDHDKLANLLAGLQRVEAVD